MKENAFRLSCRPISWVWSKCSVILRRRKWSWTILTLIRSLLHFVRAALYRLCIAQRPSRPNDSDRRRDNTAQEVLIPQFAYYIETTKAILNTNNDFFVQIGVQWRERIPYYRYKLLHNWLHSCSPDPIDPRIRIECAGDRTGQPTTILPEYCVQPNSGDKRHCAPCAINAHILLHVLRVHRGCGQWNGECASSCIDDNWGRVCEIQCSRRIVVPWSC